MRRWHNQNIDALFFFLKERSYSAYLCDCLGRKDPIAVEMKVLREYFDASFGLMGAASFEYMLFRRGPFERRMGIKAATLAIESSETEDIVVVAYSDGGAIVVTNGIVGLQEQGVAADWWQIESTRFP